MNLNQLKYFYTVCICGSLSEAAEHLYISQPSLSAAIKALENEYGILLFNRTHAGMQLTAEGNQLFRSCKEILKQAEQLEKRMKDLGNQNSKLRLGIPPMIGSLIIAQIYRDFRAAHPDIQLEVTEDGRSELLCKLSENLLDMVFLLRNNPLDSNFAALNIGKFEIVCCVAKDNPLASKTAVTPQILKDTPLVLFENSFFQTEKIKKWFAAEKIEPNILMQTKQLSTMLSLVSQNVAAGFMIKELAQANQNFITLPCKTSLSADFSLVWNKNAYNSNSMENFRNYIKENNPFI